MEYVGCNGKDEEHMEEEKLDFDELFKVVLKSHSKGSSSNCLDLDKLLADPRLDDKKNELRQYFRVEKSQFDARRKYFKLAADLLAPLVQERFSDEFGLRFFPRHLLPFWVFVRSIGYPVLDATLSLFPCGLLNFIDEIYSQQVYEENGPIKQQLHRMLAVVPPTYMEDLIKRRIVRKRDVDCRWHYRFPTDCSEFFTVLVFTEPFQFYSEEKEEVQIDAYIDDKLVSRLGVWYDHPDREAELIAWRTSDQGIVSHGSYTMMEEMRFLLEAPVICNDRVHWVSKGLEFLLWYDIVRECLLSVDMNQPQERGMDYFRNYADDRVSRLVTRWGVTDCKGYHLGYNWPSNGSNKWSTADMLTLEELYVNLFTACKVVEDTFDKTLVSNAVALFTSAFSWLGSARGVHGVAASDNPLFHSPSTKPLDPGRVDPPPSFFSTSPDSKDGRKAARNRLKSKEKAIGPEHGAEAVEYWLAKALKYCKTSKELAGGVVVVGARLRVDAANSHASVCNWGRFVVSALLCEHGYRSLGMPAFADLMNANQASVENSCDGIEIFEYAES
eukprot:GILJ01006687.1.p1 GENE.GILJ01006687.1~~GILJ01006687.1.p1  ORF type:complete len:577 (-),score=62.36 GILJ01006687.1:418-2088(-)